MMMMSSTTTLPRLFDKVLYQWLLKKMAKHDITGKVLQWVKAWLQRREECVILNRTASEWAAVDWSIVSFSPRSKCFVNYIDTTNSFISKFADDTQCGR